MTLGGPVGPLNPLGLKPSPEGGERGVFLVVLVGTRAGVFLSSETLCFESESGKMIKIITPKMTIKTKIKIKDLIK